MFRNGQKEFYSATTISTTVSHNRMKTISIIAFLFIVTGCQNQPIKPAINDHKEDLIQSTQKNTHAAELLLHHQIQKKSLVAIQTTSLLTIDSFFSYIGLRQEYDSLCFQPGLFNRYGEIRLFSDSLKGSEIGTLYFVIDGRCEGFYVSFDKSLKKYSFSPNGKIFFKSLDNKYKDELR